MTASSAIVTRPARFAGFDGLRAIAALSILVFHVTSATGANADDPLGRYLARLDAGVAVFFVISAFLLYRPFADAHLAGAAPPALRRYAVRRVLRIYPAYWVALTAAILVFRSTELRGVGDHLRHYLLVQTYQEPWGLGGIVPAWTLAVEVAFYASLPLYATVVGGLVRRRPVHRRLHGELLAAATVYASAFAFRVVVTGARGTDSPWLHALPTLADWFAVGLALAAARAALDRDVAPDVLRRAARWIARHQLALWGGAAGAFALTGHLGLPVDGRAGSAAADAARQALYGLAGGLLVAPLALPKARARGPVTRMLEHRVAVALGTVSYGVFLWHFDWIEHLVDAGFLGEVTRATTPALLLVVVALSLLSAAASWLLVERPLVRRAPRWSGGRAAASERAAP
jgi:peptidoglycan/LPS O-acetylase OafA/YrhL